MKKLLLALLLTAPLMAQIGVSAPGRVPTTYWGYGPPTTVIGAIAADNYIDLTNFQAYQCLAPPTSVVVPYALPVGVLSVTGYCSSVAGGGQWVAASSGAFAAITGGTNTTAAMVIGTGASLTVSGSGVNNANEVNGAAVAASATCAGTNSSGQIISVSCSGSSAFSALASGTNTAAAMLVGAGASLAPTSTGTISANQANGLAIPISAPGLQTNSSGQLVASNAAGGLRALTQNPLYFDDLLPGNTTTGIIGAYGWVVSQLGGGSGSGVANGPASNPHYGVMSLLTVATSGDGVSMSLSSNSATSFSTTLSTGAPYDSFFIFAPLTQAASAGQLYVGYETYNNSAAIPASFIGIRFDTTLKNVSSATCNDAGNKCGLTTLTCSATQTVTFSINGGTATGSVACTGTNAIANTTAITVTAAGVGYNSAGGAAVGTVTGGTATATGSVALTTTLGSASSGGDTDYTFCTSVTSLYSCYATTTAPANATYQNVEISNPTSGTISFSLYNSSTGSTALVSGPITICSSACTVTATPPVAQMSPAFLVTAAANTATIIYADLWAWQSIGGLSR